MASRRRLHRLQKNKMATAKMPKTRGFKTVIHKPMGGTPVATSISSMQFLVKDTETKQWTRSQQIRFEWALHQL